MAASSDSLKSQLTQVKIEAKLTTIQGVLKELDLHFEPLSESNVEQTIALAKRNASEQGFIQMMNQYTKDATFYPRHLSDRNDNQFCSVICDANKKVLGFIVFEIYSQTDDMKGGLIHALGVDKEQQGLGAGTALLFHGANELQKMGAESISLTSSTDESDTFYKKYKFIVDPHGDDESELMLPKESFFPFLEAMDRSLQSKRDTQILTREIGELEELAAQLSIKPATLNPVSIPVIDNEHLERTIGKEEENPKFKA